MTRLFLLSFAALLSIGCQSLELEKVPTSRSLEVLTNQTTNTIEIKPFRKEKVKELLRDFKVTLANKKKLSREDWSVHDRLLSAYISMKYTGRASVLAIPPKSRVVLYADSYCLNPTKGVPTENEHYFFSKKQVVPFQKDLLNYSRSNPGDWETVQEIIWNLHNGVRWESLPEKHKNILKGIDPRAPIILPSKIKDLIGENLGLSKVEDLVPEEFYDFEEFASRLKRPSGNKSALKSEPFSVADSSIFSSSTSDGFESQRITFFNPTSETVEIDTTDYVLAPVRKEYQYVGFYHSVPYDNKLFKELEEALFTEMLRVGLGTTPVIGDLIDLYEAMASKDFFTGRKLTAEERLLSTWGLLVGSGQLYRSAKKGLSAPGYYVREMSKRYKVPADPEQARALKELADKLPGKVPDDWPMVPGKVKVRHGNKKSQGLVFRDPENSSNSVRFMPGDPNAKYAHQRQPYVVARKGGRAMDKNGRQLDSAETPDAHIPLGGFDFDKVWGKK